MQKGGKRMSAKFKNIEGSIKEKDEESLRFELLGSQSKLILNIKKKIDSRKMTVSSTESIKEVTRE